MRSLFYLFTTLLVVTMFFPEVAAAAEHLLLQLLTLANSTLAGVAPA